MAGLATGCYARMNGYRTHIFEMSEIPGGVCTSWRRGDYTFDACIEWLVGSRQGSGMNQVWRELGAQDVDVVSDKENATRVGTRTHRDVTRLRSAMVSSCECVLERAESSTTYTPEIRRTTASALIEAHSSPLVSHGF